LKKLLTLFWVILCASVSSRSVGIKGSISSAVGIILHPLQAGVVGFGKFQCSKPDL
jgi:hypothetical protein